MMTCDAAFKPPVLMIATVPAKRDWRLIIAAIKAGFFAAEGRVLSDYKLGLMVGLDHSSIENLQTNANAQPKHYPGEVLLALHAEYSGKIPISQQHASEA